MCGIVGMFALNKAGFNNPHITIIEQMLYADQLRGPHGTGIFYNNRKNECLNIRGAMPATSFLKDLGVIKALTEVYNQASFVVGHNRWATRGAHTMENTHPFVQGDITLIHNGTVNNHRAMANVDVDSHAICHSFAQKGAKETIASLDGAFALVWHDGSTGLLHFIRNKERPLSIVRSKNIIVIASEPKMAEWILSRNGETVESVENCIVGKLYTFDPTSRSLSEEDIPLCPPKSKITYPIRQSNHYYPQGRFNDFVVGAVRDADLAEWYREVEEATKEVFPDNDSVIKVKDSNVSYLNGKKTFTDYKYGDVIEMTPFAVDPAGKAWKISMIVQNGMSSPTVYACFYCNSKMWADKLMDSETVSGTVIQTRYKGKECTLVVKECAIVPLKTIIDDATQSPYNAAGSSQLLLN